MLNRICLREVIHNYEMSFIITLHLILLISMETSDVTSEK
jgi:hypothetical protein